jgi:hypothetical protein
MAHKTFEETINERREAIELVLSYIAQHGGESSLHDLRVLLIDIMGMLKRDPGIEFAADDLYAAAATLVKGSVGGSHPSPRQFRLFRDARERFCQRLPVAAEQGASDERRLQGLEAAYAVQLERLSAGEEEAEEAARDAA